MKITPDLWLEKKFAGEFFTGRFDHISMIIENLGLAPKKCRVVTIAGTNGKGQSARILAEHFRLEAIPYALWTSPHLQTVAERFSLNGQNVSSDKLVSIFEIVETKLKKTEVELSYFEFLFISFLQLVEIELPEVIILEVGLGGRLDATNAVDTDIAAITSISRDHQEILGARFDKILNEKIAIMRPGKPLVTAFELKYLRDKSRALASINDAKWFDLFEDNLISKGDHFSKRNVAISQKIFELLYNRSPKGIKSIDFESSRREITKNDALFSLFPSHNVDGLRKLTQFLYQTKNNEYDLVLLAFSRRDLGDVRTMCKVLELYIPRNKTLLVGFLHSKALEREKLDVVSIETGIKICVDIEKTIKKSINENKKVLVTGSNYFLGHFSKLLDS
jgi:dihydrofolate synthase/folylpolyglutamate synthase